MSDLFLNKRLLYATTAQLYKQERSYRYDNPVYDNPVTLKSRLTVNVGFRIRITQ